MRDADGTSPRRRLRHDLAACALLVAISALAFGDVLAGWRGLYYRDLAQFSYPTKFAFRAVVSGGELPLWNRFFSAGQPFAANPQNEVFYPLNWLVLLLDYFFAFHLQILLHVWLSLIGMYALARSIGMQSAAAFFTALSWGLGGVTMSYVNLLPFLYSAGWLPLICLFARRMIVHRSRRDFALAAICLGMQLLAGEPTTALQTGLLLGCYAIDRAMRAASRLRTLATSLALLAAAACAALMLSAAQTLPAIDFAGDSARSRPFTYEMASDWSFPWQRAVELLFPSAFGHVSLHGAQWYWASALYRRGAPFLVTIYCGLLVAILALAGTLVGGTKRRLMLGVTGLSFLLALGAHTPLFRIAYDAGATANIRYPEKFVLMGLFAITLFSGDVLQRLLDGDEPLLRRALEISSAVLAIACALVAISFTAAGQTFVTRLWHWPPQSPTTDFLHGVMQRDWAIAALRAAAAFALLATLRHLRRPVWLLLLATFLVADLVPIAEEVNPRLPRSFFDLPPATRMLASDRGESRLFHVASLRAGGVADRYMATGPGAPWVVRNGLFPREPALAGIATVMEIDFDRTALHPTSDFLESYYDVVRAGRRERYPLFMAMSNARYRVDFRDFDEENRRTGGDFRLSVPVTFEDDGPAPRYYFAESIEPIAGRADFVRKIVARDWPRRVAFVEGHEGFATSGGAVRSVVESANGADLRVTSAGNNLLVMSVTPDRHWRISIDGRRVEPLLTNVGYQAVVVGAGEHRIAMRYVNPLVAAGAVVSIFTLFVLVAVAIRSRTADALGRIAS